MDSKLEKLSFSIFNIFSKKSCGLILDFVSSIILVRMLGAESYGIYVTIFLFPHLVSSFGSMGLGPAIIFFINRMSISVSQLTHSLAFISIILGLCYSILFSFFIDFISNYIEYEVPSKLLLIASIVIPFTLIQKYFGAILIAENKLNYHTNVLILFPAIARTILFIALSLLSYANNLFNVILIVVLIRIIFSLAIFFRQLFFCSSANDKSRKFLSFTDMKKLLNFGLKSHLGGIIERSNREISILIMVGFLNAESIANYNIALRISNLLLQIGDVSGIFLQRSISKSRNQEIISFYPNVSRLVILLLVFGIIVISSLSPMLIPLMYTNELSASVSILNILIFGTAFLVLVDNNNAVFTQTGKPLMKSKIRSLGFFLNLLLLYLLLPSMGLIGAAVAYSGSYIFMYLISTYMVIKYFKFKISDLIFINASDFSLLKKSVKSILTIKK